MKTTSRYLIPSQVPLAPEALTTAWQHPPPLFSTTPVPFPPSQLQSEFSPFPPVQLHESHPGLSWRQLQPPDMGGGRRVNTINDLLDVADHKSVLLSHTGLQKYRSFSSAFTSNLVLFTSCVIIRTSRYFCPWSAQLRLLRKMAWKREKTEPALKRNSHVALTRCSNLGYKHSTNHLCHPSLWSAAPLVCSQPASGCKFFPPRYWESRWSERWTWRNLRRCFLAIVSLCVSVGVKP